MVQQAELPAANSELRLRVIYIGPNMDLAEAAYREEHKALGHDTRHLRSVGDVKLLQPTPDVVVINPLVITSEGIEGACALQAVVPATTVIVALYTSLGISHAMFTRHALAGHCHPRMLLHYPDPALKPVDILTRIDRLARRKGGGAQIADTGHLPASLTDSGRRTGLGELLVQESGTRRSASDSLTYGRLLYTAATDSTWTTWGDLAQLLGFAEGHVKNTRTNLGKALRSSVLPEAGVPLPKQEWRIPEFTRFVTEHRSFIRAFCEHHLHEASCWPMSA